MPHYYHFASQPRRYYSDYQSGQYWPGSRAATTRALGEMPLEPDLSYDGTGWTGFQKSRYKLSTRPRGNDDRLFYYERPNDGAPEPLSPQMYPQWQAQQLGFWDGLSDNEKKLATVAAVGVGAYLLFFRK